MSSTKSAVRRLSLLAGSSLVAATLSTLCAGGVALAPSAALAYDECVPADGATLSDGADGASDPSLNGGTADSFGCAASTYATGITYTAEGNLIVSKTNSDTTDVGTAGVNLTATGVDAITWQSTAGVVSTNTGQVLDIQTQSGNITVDAFRFTNFGDGVTHGIRAISTDGGDVNITVSSNYANGSNAAPAVAGIEARSIGGGDVTISATDVTGYDLQHAILASVTGGGTLTISAGNAFLQNNGVNNTIAALHATTDTGLMTISGSYNNESGPTGMRLIAGGDIVFNGIARAGMNVGWGADITNTAGSLTSLTGTINNGSPTGGALRVQGGGDVVYNVSAGFAAQGRIDVSGAGDFDMTIAGGGGWQSAGASVFSAAGNTLSIADNGLLVLSHTTPFNPTTGTGGSIDFGAGADLLSNAGTIRINTEATFLGLEAFDNGGLLDLTDGATTFDRMYDNVLTMPGTTFTGLAGGQMLVHVNYGRADQTACSVDLKDANGQMPVADCLAIPGGATAGVTSVILDDVFPFDQGAPMSDGAVLVDVSGGESAAGHFIVDPASDHYSSENGGIVDKGVFFYTIAYDADNQQHKLIGLPSDDTNQLAILSTAAQDVWRVSTRSLFDRQADLRGDLEPGIGGGLWLRVSTEFADRDAIQSITAAGNTFDFDNTHNQSTYAVTGGIDLLTGEAGDTAYVLGVMAGYTHSDVEWANQPNASQFDGWTGGVYASYLSGGLFVDAALNANRLVMDHDVPVFTLFPAGTILSTHVVSVGAQVEAGWRFPVMGNAFMEPVASISYVKSEYDGDFVLPADDPVRTGVGVEYDDPTSLRASLGARAGADYRIGGNRLQLTVLGRYWNEFEGENRVILHTARPDVVMLDDFSGDFTEFGVGLNLYSSGGAVSGFLNFGGKFGDDYKAQNASTGVRVNW